MKDSSTKISNLTLPFQVLWIAFRGWLHIYKKIFLKVFHYLYQKTLVEKILILFCFVQSISTGFGWFQYTIHFQENPETILIYGSPVVVFLVGSFFNLIIISLWKGKWVWPMFFLFQLIMLTLLIAGVLYPNEVFVGFLNPMDFQFTIYFYIFCLSCVLALIFGLVQYKEERKKFQSPIIPTVE